MKTLNKTIKYIMMLSVVSIMSCSDFLNEKSVTDATSDSYLLNEKAFENLVTSNYSLLRNIHRERSLVMNGTDLFCASIGWQRTDKVVGNPLDLYDIRMNSSMNEISALWDVLYKQIERSNKVVSRAEKIPSLDPDIKAIRVAEAKFLRAFAYFYLVQLWGDIPMPLDEVSSANRDIVREPANVVYQQILTDLHEAEAMLPKIASDYGRATKGAAQFLLSRVYLTRGWNDQLGAQPDDFDKALRFADQIIEAYPLAATYKDLFPKRSDNPLFETFPAQNDKNPEVIFAVQYSSDVLSYLLEDITGDKPYLPLGGNDAHSVFGGSGEDIPGSLGRTSHYNRHQSLFTPTPALHRLFDPQNDQRYQHDFVRVQYAMKDASGFQYSLKSSDTINIKKGDTVIIFRPWNQPAPLQEKGIDVGGTRRYAVVNIDQIGAIDKSRFHDEDKLPLMWKFWEPGIPYGDAFGTFDLALFRSAEAYLIAAEAILKGGKGARLGSAEIYYNAVLDRAIGKAIEPQCAAVPEDLSSLAAVSYRATSSNLNIDLILDERARELMGEYTRWFDLKRTGKLIERTSRMNPWTKQTGEMQSFHLLRPIPQHEIDRSTTTIQQNDGYK